ncbi:hypothetical protein HDV05_002612 [Chytridiales sp. JEL 0842]|nr:hypothetical protein HDV05_002612 [Chytridiales sp. JEL 0842]
MLASPLSTQPLKPKSSSASTSPSKLRYPSENLSDDENHFDSKKDTYISSEDEEDDDEEAMDADFLINFLGTSKSQSAPTPSTTAAPLGTAADDGSAWGSGSSEEEEEEEEEEDYGYDTLDDHYEEEDVQTAEYEDEDDDEEEDEEEGAEIDSGSNYSLDEDNGSVSSTDLDKPEMDIKSYLSTDSLPMMPPPPRKSDTSNQRQKEIKMKVSMPSLSIKNNNRKSSLDDSSEEPASPMPSSPPSASTSNNSTATPNSTFIFNNTPHKTPRSRAAAQKLSTLTSSNLPPQSSLATSPTDTQNPLTDPSLPTLLADWADDVDSLLSTLLSKNNNIVLFALVHASSLMLSAFPTPPLFPTRIEWILFALFSFHSFHRAARTSLLSLCSLFVFLGTGVAIAYPLFSTPLLKPLLPMVAGTVVYLYTITGILPANVFSFSLFLLTTTLDLLKPHPRTELEWGVGVYCVVYATWLGFMKLVGLVVEYKNERGASQVVVHGELRMYPTSLMPQKSLQPSSTEESKDKEGGGREGGGTYYYSNHYDRTNRFELCLHKMERGVVLISWSLPQSLIVTLSSTSTAQQQQQQQQQQSGTQGGVGKKGVGQGAQQGKSVPQQQGGGHPQGTGPLMAPPPPIWGSMVVGTTYRPGPASSKTSRGTSGPAAPPETPSKPSAKCAATSTADKPVQTAPPPPTPQSSNLYLPPIPPSTSSTTLTPSDISVHINGQPWTKGIEASMSDGLVKVKGLEGGGFFEVVVLIRGYGSVPLRICLEDEGRAKKQTASSQSHGSPLRKNSGQTDFEGPSASNTPPTTTTTPLSSSPLSSTSPNPPTKRQTLNTLLQSILTLQTSKKTLQLSLKKLKKDLSKSLAHSRTDLESLQRLMAKDAASELKSRQRLVSLMEQLRQTESGVENLKREMEGVVREKEKWEVEKEEAGKRLSALKDSLKKVEKGVSRKLALEGKVLGGLKEGLGGFEAQVEGLRNRLAGLEGELRVRREERMKVLVRSLEKGLKSKKEAQRAAEDVKRKGERELERRKGEVERLRGRVEDFEGRVEELRERVGGEVRMKEELCEELKKLEEGGGGLGGLFEMGSNAGVRNANNASWGVVYGAGEEGGIGDDGQRGVIVATDDYFPANGGGTSWNRGEDYGDNGTHILGGLSTARSKDRPMPPNLTIPAPPPSTVAAMSTSSFVQPLAGAPNLLTTRLPLSSPSSSSSSPSSSAEGSDDPSPRNTVHLTPNGDKILNILGLDMLDLETDPHPSSHYSHSIPLPHHQQQQHHHNTYSQGLYTTSPTSLNHSNERYQSRHAFAFPSDSSSSVDPTSPSHSSHLAFPAFAGEYSAAGGLRQKSSLPYMTSSTASGGGSSNGGSFSEPESPGRAI